ncbi:1-deoxy-D-xylulose-5-phosphate synthase [uncultured archaeon]|nr:1-deoxy-D-xylulose-5-phosphate synthase [uncultured archaeon]
MHVSKFRFNDVKRLKLLSNQARIILIETLATSKSGHSAGPLGLADVFVSLYFKILKNNPKKPSLNSRDRLFVSNGHVCPIQYVVMSQAGYFPQKELKTLRKINSRLQGHPSRKDLPGIENSSGPLGQGISQACGAAFVIKKEKLKQRIYCIISDAEFNEGQTWEALLFAAKNKLPLTILVDRNNIQITGNTEDVMPLEPLKQKLMALNLTVEEVDGHNHLQIISVCNNAKKNKNTTIIICHTIPGKGVSFMENKYEWHGKPPNEQEARKALEELYAEQAKLR